MSDPNYQPSPALVTATTVEVALLTFEQMVRTGTIPPGTYLIPADGQSGSIAEVTEDGAILLDDVEYRSPDEAARADGAHEVDGWLYWSAEMEESVLLDDLRRGPGRSLSG